MVGASGSAHRTLAVAGRSPRLQEPSVPNYLIDNHAQNVLFREAHTAHAFTDAPVPDELIADALDLVQWAPTSMNSSPMRVVLVRSADRKQQLMGHLAEPNRAKSAGAPLNIVLAADTDFHLTLPRLVPAAVNPQDRFPDATARAEFARNQAWMQVAYLVVGLRAVGLAVGPMTGFNAAGVDADFFAGTPLRALAVLNVGHPAEGAFRPRAPRLGFHDVVSTV